MSDAINEPTLYFGIDSESQDFVGQRGLYWNQTFRTSCMSCTQVSSFGEGTCRMGGGVSWGDFEVPGIFSGLRLPDKLPLHAGTEVRRDASPPSNGSNRHRFEAVVVDWEPHRMFLVQPTASMVPLQAPARGRPLAEKEPVSPQDLATGGSIARRIQMRKR
jgi:hypothetical protein